MDSLPRFVPGPHNLQIKQCYNICYLKCNIFFFFFLIKYNNIIEAFKARPRRLALEQLQAPLNYSAMLLAILNVMYTKYLLLSLMCLARHLFKIVYSTKINFKGTLYVGPCTV